MPLHLKEECCFAEGRVVAEESAEISQAAEGEGREVHEDRAGGSSRARSASGNSEVRKFLGDYVRKLMYLSAYHVLASCTTRFTFTTPNPTFILRTRTYQTYMSTLDIRMRVYLPILTLFLTFTNKPDPRTPINMPIRSPATLPLLSHIAVIFTHLPGHLSHHPERRPHGAEHPTQAAGGESRKCCGCVEGGCEGSGGCCWAVGEGCTDADERKRWCDECECGH